MQQIYMIATMPKCEITLRHGSYPVHFCCIFSEHLFVGTTLDGCFRSNKPRKYSAAAQTYSENNARIFITLLKTICMEAVVPWSIQDVVSTFTRRLHDVSRAYRGVKNVRFSENLACFVYLKHPF